jgi:septum formation protein
MDRIGTSVNLVLASQSPRRREILDMMGLGGKYTTQPSPLDEESLQTELISQKLSSTDYTHRLAQAKAHALAVTQASSLTTTTFYLGSDTIVELDDMVLEKPKNTDQAKEMLRKLSGRDHHVHTGVAIYKVTPGSEVTTTLVSSFVDTAQVTFATLSELDIAAYVQSGEPMDKAGSYGIQGIGGQFVSGLTGDFFTVMGLPMHKTSRALAQAIRDEDA